MIILDNRVEQFKQIQRDAVNRYTERYKRLGVVPQALGWGKKEDQVERFNSLAKNINFQNKKVLDVGCGFADLYMYLKENEIECDYTGIDIIPDFIEYCCGKYPGREFYHKNILTDTASIPKADIVISLGTLNFKLSVMENLEYTREFKI